MLVGEPMSLAVVAVVSMRTSSTTKTDFPFSACATWLPVTKTVKWVAPSFSTTRKPQPTKTEPLAGGMAALTSEFAGAVAACATGPVRAGVAHAAALRATQST